MIQATPEQVRQIAKEVLARPEFQEKPTLAQLFVTQLIDALRRLVEWSERNPELSRVLTIILAIVLAGLIAHIIYTVFREFTSLRKPGGEEAYRRRADPLEGVAEDWAEAFRLARMALDAGELYRGLWIAHRILLSVLDRMGQIKFVRWKTNTDYLQECGDAASVRATLFGLTAAYERVIYAHTDFDRVEAEKLVAQVEALAAEAVR